MKKEMKKEIRKEIKKEMVWLISNCNIKIWWIQYEANKKFYIDEEINKTLKNSIFFKKGNLKYI